MGNFTFNSQPKVLIIADADDELVGYVKNLLGNYEIESELCANIYEAVGLLAKTDTRNIFAVGRFEQLNKEKGRFFQKLTEKTIRCCCLTHRQIPQEQSAALEETGVFIVKEMDAIEAILAQYLESGAADQPIQKQDAAHFNANEFAATEAEIDALLGND